MTDWEAVVQGWCEQLPQGVLDALATVALAGPAMGAPTLRSASSAPVLRAAQLARDAVEAGEGPYLAGLLRGVRMAKADVPALRAVWTGPESAAASGRLTLAVVADLLSEATHEVLLVSYAAYPAPDIVAALTAAVARGVSVTLLLEPDEWSGGGLISLNELRRIHYMAMTPVWNIAPHPDATPEESPGSFRQHDIHPFSGGMTPPGSMRWFVRARQ